MFLQRGGSITCEHDYVLLNSAVCSLIAPHRDSSCVAESYATVGSANTSAGPGLSSAIEKAVDNKFSRFSAPEQLNAEVE